MHYTEIVCQIRSGFVSVAAIAGMVLCQILPDSADDENGLPSPNLVYGEKAYKVFEAKTSDEEEVISLCAGLVCIVFVSSRSRSIGKLILDYLELSHLRRFKVETTKLGFFF